MRDRLYGRPYDAAVHALNSCLSSLVTLALGLTFTAPIPRAAAFADLAASAEPAEDARAYLGLVVRDIPDVGCVVSRIHPGPLDGEELSSPTLHRPDLLVSIEGKPASSKVLNEVLAAKSPGDTIGLAYRRSKSRGPALPTAVDHVDEVESLSVVLADAATWSGTVGAARRPAHDAPMPTAALLTDAAITGELAKDPPLQPALDSVIAGLRAMSAALPDARRLSRVTAALTEPLALPELAEAMVAPTTRGLRPMRLAADLAAAQLDATPSTIPVHGSVPVPGAQSAYYALDFFTGETRLFLREALGDAFDNEAVARAALDLAGCVRPSLLVHGDRAKERLATIRRGAEIDMDKIVATIAQLDADLAIDPSVATSEPEGVPEDLPANLKSAVAGTVLTMQPLTDGGWAVVGGPGPNRYDLSKISAVLDLGGDDTYTMSDLAIGMRVVIDIAGNDTYQGNAAQGFACGVGGLFLVDDHAGNDRYTGSNFNAGAACFGVGILLDRAGDDEYEGATWSLGAACWGVGILMDQGGSDSYRAEFLSEGCGGPRGFGALVDFGGNDVYRADGVPSQYGSAATTSSFSQGIGFGMRHVAAGGIGLLSDLGGDDRYIAGEFSQGGGYYFGLGMLHDAGGNDCYVGDRYGQAWSAHQASGILLEGGGDDTYYGRTAANQGAAWDQSTALLWDRGGSDSYQADGLSQGAAAQQAIAILIDDGGADRYIARAESSQGCSGRNEYHFGEPAPTGGIFSFSLFWDRRSAAAGEADEPDVFSTGRPHGAAQRTGRRDGTTAANSTLSGLFIDAGR